MPLSCALKVVKVPFFKNVNIWGIWSLELWIKCCQRRENTISKYYWEIRKMQVTTKRLGIIFHYRDEVYKGAIWWTVDRKISRERHWGRMDNRLL